MNKISLVFLLISLLPSFESVSQPSQPDYKKSLIIIERLSPAESAERSNERLRRAQVEDNVSTEWPESSPHPRGDKILNKNYNKIIDGLKRENIRFKIVNAKEFEDLLAHPLAEETYYLTQDFEVKEIGAKKRYLVISMSFKLLDRNKKVLMDESAGGIVKLITR